MAAETATAMNVVVANGAMAVATVEEVPVAMGTAGATPDMVATEGAVAMVTAAVTAAATTTISIPFLKPASSLFFNVFWRRHTRRIS